MKPVKQLYRHKPDQLEFGDCHRACIASILELDIHEVPHFGYDGCTDIDIFNKRVANYLETKNLCEVTFAFNCILPSLLRMMKLLNPNVYYIVGGQSKNKVNHSVICYNDEIVHDPSLDNSGIESQCDDNHFWISILVPLKY